MATVDGTRPTSRHCVNRSPWESEPDRLYAGVGLLVAEAGHEGVCPIRGVNGSLTANFEPGKSTQVSDYRRSEGGVVSALFGVAADACYTG